MIELNCPECGNNRFSFPANMRDETHILCETCGHDMGTLRQLQDRVAGEVGRARRTRS